MAPSGLDAALRQRAHEAAEAIVRAARQEAARIAAEAEAAIEERRANVLGSREDEHQANARAAIAAARQESMRTVLLAKTGVVDRVLERARALIPDVKERETFRVALAEEVTEALAFVGAEGTLVRCSRALRPALVDALRAAPEVVVEVADEVGTGFVMVGEAGRVRVDGTLETRLHRLAPTLAIEIHGRLEER